VTTRPFGNKKENGFTSSNWMVSHKKDRYKKGQFWEGEKCSAGGKRKKLGLTNSSKNQRGVE